MRINTNSLAINARNNLSMTESRQAKSLEKLSSGFRINRAGDDAAGLVISEGLRSQVGGLKMAVRNAQDGVSVVQTAEGALTEVHSMLQRMRDLTVQAGNTGANDTDARSAIASEITQLTEEIDRIGNTTKFGSTNLLDGSYGKTAGTLSTFVADDAITVAATHDIDVSVAGGSGTVTVTVPAQTASSTAEFAESLENAIKGALLGTGNAVDAAAAEGFTLTSEASGSGHVLTANNLGSAAITIADGTGTPLADESITGLVGTVAAASGTGGVFQVGANANETISVAISDMRSTALGVNGLDVSDAANVATSLGLIDTAIDSVSTQRGSLGATQNRLEHTINNLSVTAENLTASESRIRDTDMASEMMEFTRNQILSQAGTAMLAQANQVPQGVLSLLR